MEHTREINRQDDSGVVIECKSVSKQFDVNGGKEIHKVLDSIDLKVFKNEFLVLFGPGQIGKTTLLNIIAGLDQATSGSVYENGIMVTKPEPSRGVVYQSIALFPWLTVMGNVEFGPKVKGIPKKERQEMAQHFIDLVGLTGFENTFPAKLSGGMKQRVGIARAYCNNPDVILMDEPFGALDAQTRYMMQEELGKISQKEKNTVIFVTNNIEEAIYLADRIVLLADSPAKIKHEYIIDLPRPRSLVSPDFLKIRKEISEAMDVKI